MKIAVFSDNFYPELSGISDSIKSQVIELGKLGHIVRIYAPKYPMSSFKASSVPFAEPDFGPNVRIKRLFSIPYPSGSGQSRIIIPVGLSLLNIKNFKPDIIHTHLFFGAGIEALIASKIFNIPIVGTNHTSISEFIKFSLIKIPGLPKAGMLYSSFYYNRCAFVSTPSAVLLQEMRENGLAAESQVYGNPIDTSLFYKATEQEKIESRKKFNLKGLVIIYAGRLSPEKNIDILVKSFALVSKKIPEAILVIAGHGGEKKNLTKLAESLGITNKVIFMETMNHENLASLYRAGDIFATASVSETQPISLLQAFASGLPSVGADARGLKEYISEDVGELFKPHDIFDMGRALKKILQNEDLRKSMGESARVKSEIYDVKNVVSKWEELYREIIKT